jgi:hypothetical protein
VDVDNDVDADNDIGHDVEDVAEHTGLSSTVEDEATEEQSFTDADTRAPWSDPPVTDPSGSEPDDSTASSEELEEEEVDDAELIDEVDDVEEGGDLDALVPSRSAAPPSRRASHDPGDVPKPPPPPSTLPRKD